MQLSYFNAHRSSMGNIMTGMTIQYHLTELAHIIFLDEKLELNKSNTGIPGLINKYILSSKSWTLDENTAQALTTSYTNSLLIKPERNGFDIDFFKFDNSNSNWDFAYALGLSNLFVDGSYLTDIMSLLSKQNIPKTLLLLAK